jgi:predicted alpha/beta-hydrolase family hydrolase
MPKKTTLNPDPDLLIEGSKDAPWTVALAHGAGAGMNTPFMDFFARHLSTNGFRVVRFEFPYMASRKKGMNRPPDREPVLRATWLRVIEILGANRLVIGGKSMGGRMATLVADEALVAGLICLGYPFHPVGQPTRLRVEHLRSIKTRTLILQGERDSFGNREEVARYELSSAISIEWLIDGDHSFRPRKASGQTESQNWQAAATKMAAFIANLESARGPG